MEKTSPGSHSEAALPPGWSAHQSKSNPGHFYYFNCVINPIVYSILNERFRKECKQFFCVKKESPAHQLPTPAMVEKRLLRHPDVLGRIMFQEYLQDSPSNDKHFITTASKNNKTKSTSNRTPTSIKSTIKSHRSSLKNDKELKKKMKTML